MSAVYLHTVSLIRNSAANEKRNSLSLSLCMKFEKKEKRERENTEVPDNKTGSSIQKQSL